MKIPAYFLAALYGLTVMGARIVKFRASGFSPELIVQDLAASAVLLWVLATLWRRRTSMRVFAGLIWSLALVVSVVGIVVVSLLKIPITAPMLLTLPDLVFVRTALGVGVVANAVNKMVGLIVVAHVIAWIGVRIVRRRHRPLLTQQGERVLRSLTLGLCLPVLIVDGDRMHRDSNSLVSIVRSVPRLIVAEPSTVLSTLEPRLLNLPTSGTNVGFGESISSFTSAVSEPLHLIIYLLETGHARTLQLGSQQVTSDSHWLPYLAEVARRSIRLDMHHSPWWNSTKSIYGLVTSQYPYADYRTSILMDPRQPGFGMFRSLQEQGYATAALASIDGDYDRMDSFLRNHGIATVEDRDSLGLSKYADPTFGNDQQLVDAYFAWRANVAPTRQPSAAMIMPSNSHWPGFFPAEFATEQAASQSAIEQQQARYRNALRYQEHVIQHLYEQLDARGWLNNTVVAIVPDHGVSLGLASDVNAADPLGREEFHVPVLIDIPVLRTVAGGVTVAVPTSHVDLGPTLLGLLSPSERATTAASSIAPDSSIQGRDLANARSNRIVYMLRDHAGAEVIGLAQDTTTTSTRYRATMYEPNQVRSWIIDSALDSALAPVSDRSMQKIVQEFAQQQPIFMLGRGQP